ncbi:MAG: SpoVG family protein [Ruminococcus sp.]|nr:SpoVG family protein [Ruminococcus sp.]
MNISEIKVRKVLPSGKLRGVVSLTIDDVLAVHDIKVIQGDERLFVAMPSRRDESGVFRDIVHPINSAARAELEQRILEAFREAETREQSAGGYS